MVDRILPVPVDRAKDFGPAEVALDLRQGLQADASRVAPDYRGNALRNAVLARPVAKLVVPVLASAISAVAAVAAPQLGLLLVPVAFAAVVILWLVAAPGRLRRAFTAALGTLLIGYAFLGRGLAHVGVPPVYVGELVLGLGILALVVGRSTFRLDLIRLLLMAFMLWGALRTFPYISVFGVNALRDAVTWGYAIFAILIAAIVTAPDLLRAVDRYRTLVAPFCVFMLVQAAIPTAALPALPGSDVSIVSVKAGDASVHVAGIAAFVLVGLYVAAATRIPEILVWVTWLPTAVFMGVVTRGGLGAIAMSGLAVLFGRAPARLLMPVLVVLIALVTVVYIDPVVDIGTNREVSVGQVIENVTSVFGETDDPSLEGTKDYRLKWWGKIFDYTFKGPYFWAGKGFGVNLADEDGFQVFADHSLRAPHNGHVEILARMGVPGLALWVAVNLAWAATVVGAVRRARAAGAGVWAAVLIWLIVYWAAMLVNASFDPYLQGPQGGIWYWAVIGAGLVVSDLVRGLTVPIVRGVSRAPSTQPAGA